jgi:hypothetical protein
MELFYGAFNKREVALIKKHTSSLSLLHITEDVSQKAVELIEKYGKSHNLALADALIAATAMVTDLKLLTYNLKDFRFISGLKLH